MSWTRLKVAERPQRKRSRPHLDESVPAAVETLLLRAKYRPTTSRRRRLTGHSDDDQAALSWRERRTLVTFDWDFFEPRNIPTHRTPAVVILDCDRGSARDVANAVQAFADFEHVLGALVPKTRLVVRADGVVSAWTTAGPHEAPNARYRFRAGKPPMIWE